MFKAYKYRIYPTKDQKVLLDKHFGACRFIYNLALETKQSAYIGNKITLSAFDLMKQMTELKQDLSWLKEVNAQALQNSIVNMDKAYTQFFKGSAKYPNFKKKNGKQSFGCPQSTIVDFDHNKIYIINFREGIKCIFSRKFKGDIKTTTITKVPSGKYFVSILVENKIELPKKKPIKESTSIGLDLGIKSFIVTSDGLKVDNPKYLKNNIFRLKKLQRKLSKKQKGSKNRLKAKHNVALLHEKITNQRKDFLHKLSSKLISENQTICIEDLNVSGMIKNHNLAQSIADSSWGMFIQFLKYKSEWYGKNILTIGRFDPSSKMCSNCGTVNKELTLDQREWTCSNCNTEHDRDHNAAKNIKTFALKKVRGGTPNLKPVENMRVRNSMKQEYLIEGSNID